jgi:hypothetical protein
MTAQEVREAVDAFSARYIDDWDQWLAVRPANRAELFGQILRRWQATRPLPMRRTRREATHRPPYLEDLLEMARRPVEGLGDLDVRTVGHRTPGQDVALVTLWDLFAGLSATGTASCVGISKSVMLVTAGRIGPAFDSQVRSRTGLSRPATSRHWVDSLECITGDIAAFEAANGPLSNVVSPRFAHLAVGRLYDMALGPRALPS